MIDKKKLQSEIELQLQYFEAGDDSTVFKLMDILEKHIDEDKWVRWDNQDLQREKAVIAYSNITGKYLTSKYHWGNWTKLQITHYQPLPEPPKK